MTSTSDLDAQTARVWDVLRGIDDPEMPISIVDLGIVVDVDVDGACVTIRLTPTFTGCPALDMIFQNVRDGVGAVEGIDRVIVEQIFEPPWSVERISAQGKERLREHGVTVPGQRLVQLNVASREVVNCPYCGSDSTRLDSHFGPTRCRVIYYCQACSNPFEHLKAV